MKYAGFWRRLAAGVVDTVVLLPVTALAGWALSLPKTAAIVLVLATSVVAPLYHVVLHARFGQTIGKMVARVRVTRVSGEAISWREATLRSSVDIVLAVLHCIPFLLAVAQFSELDWSVGWMDKTRRVQELQPVWALWLMYAMQAWIWSEVVVMLSNRRRRALHDFIAGTVVVQAGADVIAAPEAASHVPS